MSNYCKTLTLALASVLLTSLGVLANPTTTPGSEPYQSNEYDSLSGGPTDFNPLDFIHRANLGNPRNGEQFQEDTNQNIDSAAEEFRRQQQERLLEQQQ